MNVLLALFNMIPCRRSTAATCSAASCAAHLADRFDALRPYGMFILYALMLTGVLGYSSGRPTPCS